MYCAKVQTSGNAAIVLDPPTSHLAGHHLADALRFRASAPYGHVFVNPSDSIGPEGKHEVQGSKSTWLERLKPRDDMELSRGAVTEVALETAKPEKECPRGRLEVGVRSTQPDCASQVIGRRPNPTWQAESSLAAKRQKTFDDKDCSEAERHRSEICHEKALKSELGKGIAVSAGVLPTNVGFGPWVNFSFGRRSETEKTVHTLKNVVHAAEGGQEACKDVHGTLHSAFTTMPKCGLAVTQGDANISPTLCKPFMPPRQSKHGLPPRPPGQKLTGSHFPSKPAALANGFGRGAFHQVANEHQPIEHAITTLATQPLGMQDKKAEKDAEAALPRVGPSFEKTKLFDQSIVDSTWDRKVLPSCLEQLPSTLPMRIDNGSISSKEQLRAVVNGIGTSSLLSGPLVEGCSDVATGRLLEDCVREPVCTNGLSSTPLMDLQSKFMESGAETFKVSLENNSALQDVSLEETNSMLQQSHMGSSHLGKRILHEQVADASTTATLPWELFTEPAGVSKKAREQFVQVYNRARDELKNQRLLQSTSRASSRELDGGPNLSLVPGSAASDAMIELQSERYGHHSLERMQNQGRNSKLEHQTSSHSSSIKEQNIAMSHADGTKRDQVEGVQQLQPLSEGQRSLSRKTALQDFGVEKSKQITAERSRMKGKVSSSGNREGQIFPGKCARNPKELVHKVVNDIQCESSGQHSKAGQDKSNGYESVPVLGKRPRVTFEDHAKSLVAEKGAMSKARPQSKPNTWLQRWHSAPTYNMNGVSANVQVGTDGKRNDTQSYHTVGLQKVGDGDGIGVFGKASAQSERVKNLTSSPKVLPSAAAMAIVGTAARQFCSSQQQSKRSFAFWSGFGMPTYHKVEPAQKKGKEKVLLKANTNLPSY